MLSQYFKVNDYCAFMFWPSSFFLIKENTLDSIYHFWKAKPLSSETNPALLKTFRKHVGPSGPLQYSMGVLRKI